MLPQSFNFDHTHSHFKKLLYFGGTAFLGEILSSPLERIKIILQTKPTLYTKSLFQYKELHLTFKEITNEEGWPRLYYGIKASLDKQVFFNIIRFYGYYYALDYLFSNPEHEYRYIPAFLSCIIGTSLGTMATQASDLLKIRIQTEPIGNDKDKLIGSRVKLKKIGEMHGNRSKVLFSGLSVNIWLQNTHAIAELFMFFKLRNFFERTDLFTSSYTVNTLSIILTNTFTTFLVAPLDYLHTHTVLNGIKGKPVGMKKLFTQLYKNQGIGAFYRGYIPLLTKTITMNTTIATILQYLYNKYQNKLIYDENVYHEMEYLREKEREKYRP